MGLLAAVNVRVRTSAAAAVASVAQRAAADVTQSGRAAAGSRVGIMTRSVKADSGLAACARRAG